MAVSEADVRSVYRNVLGREPENEDALAAHMNAPDIHALYRGFLDSEEFRARLDSEELRARLAATPAKPRRWLTIEHRADATQLTALLTAVSAYWGRIGVTEPYWSVLTQDSFRMDQIAAHRAEFHALGLFDLQLVQDAVARFWRGAAPPARIVEFGCGVGRVSAHLCAHFAQVVICDVSRAHLRHAVAHLREAGHANFRPFKVSADALVPPQPTDIWFSRLVLQHNPPPVQRAILEQSLRRLRRGGLAIFQTPTWWRGYRFVLEKYLAGRIGRRMEMHVLPLDEVLAIGAEAGCDALSVRDDTPSIGDPAVCQSHMFVFRKR